MEENELNSVVKELDDMAMRMLSLMKEYINVKLTLEELIKSGSLHLAKSRYIMGNKTVSALQLPTEGSNEFTAAAKVSMKGSNPDNVLFELSRLSINATENDVRSRKPNNASDENCVNIDKVQDPLKWFGVLVPQNMRLAQTNFTKALDYIIQAGNIQLEMDRIKSSYHVALKKKQELLKLCL